MQIASTGGRLGVARCQSPRPFNLQWKSAITCLPTSASFRIERRHAPYAFLTRATAASAPATASVTPPGGATTQRAGTPRLLCALACVGAAAVVFNFLPAHAATAAAPAASNPAGPLTLVKGALHLVLHLDKVLADLVTAWGPATYAALFGIVFAETGLVITPFLPGDSLLFATGALAAMGRLDVVALAATFIAAATLGDAVNYAIGSTLGSKALHSSLIKPDHVAKTRDFYAKYGGKTVVLARFVPIVRTFAPFVAGVGSMPYGQFALYNVAGAVLWTAVCVGAGFAFGNVPAVQENFGALVLGIVAVSLLPVAYEVWVARKSRKQGGCGASGRAGREPGGQALASTFRL